MYLHLFVMLSKWVFVCILLYCVSSLMLVTILLPMHSTHLLHACQEGTGVALYAVCNYIHMMHWFYVHAYILQDKQICCNFLPLSGRNIALPKPGSWSTQGGFILPKVVTHGEMQALVVHSVVLKHLLYTSRLNITE